MLPVETLGAFLAASVVMGLAPGPDILFVLTQSALYGARAGFATTCGLITGLFVHITAVSLGVAALFQSSETAFNVLKFAGAAYLLYLAWLSFRSGTSKASLQRAQFPGYGTLYRRGVIMNITNPKVTLFFLAFLPQFADPARGGLTAQIIVLGALFLAFCIAAVVQSGLKGNQLPHGYFSKTKDVSTLNASRRKKAGKAANISSDLPKEN